MRLKIPLTGTVLDVEQLIGDPEDPIRIIDIDLGDVSWQAVSFDLEAGLVEVEADVPRRQLAKLPGKEACYLHELTAEEQEDTRKGRVAFERFDETEQQYQARKAQILGAAKHLLESHTIDELYQMSGSARLRKPK